MQTPENIDGLILAGGAGRRAGGRDKGLLDWQGKPLVAWASERMRLQTSRLRISCNRNLEVYAAYADAVFMDLRPGFQGPLAGLAALPTPAREFLLLVPCDTPHLPLNLGATLYQALTSQPTPHDLAYATTGEQHHYLHALLRRRCWSSLPAYLDAGGRSVRGWYETLRCVSVEFGNAPGAFDNHNNLAPPEVICTTIKKPAPGF